MWEDNLPRDEDPERYIQPFVDLLSGLERKFATDKSIIASVIKEKTLVERWVEQTLADIAERDGDGDRGYHEPEYDSGEYTRAEERVATAGRTGKAMGIVKHDWPEYDEETPEVYKDSELEKFYKACDEEEARWFRFFEWTGMREGEVQHCQWSWIDLDEKTITVQPNKRQNWRPKKNKTRHIPMSSALYDLLKDWRKKADSTCDLVFPTSGCNVKLDFLDCLKAIAKRAGLFCGKCEGCVNEEPNCGRWFLHKFRATFGTRVLRKTDVRTAMEWLGHTDMESTMRYLRPAEGKDAQDKINAVFS
jgi:integrase